MSAPRRPGDDRRAGRRTDGADTPPADDAAPRSARPPKGKGWAKAKPRDKPLRPRKPGGKADMGKAGDRPATMHADGPHREGERPVRSATARPDAAARADRGSERPTRSRATPRDETDRPDRSARPDRARNRGPAPAPRPSRARDADAASRPTREAFDKARDDNARGTLRPAYGTPHPPRAAPPRDTPIRDAAAGEARARPARPPRPARPAGAKAADAPPNRAARRAEAREEAAAVQHAPQRIAKLLARAGIASRRKIERMIEERRIAIDGASLETPATIVTSLAGVTVDGRPVAAPAPARLFLFHKPPGVLTAERDFSGRRTIYDLLPEGLPRVVPVGRLDLNTEGLLLLTTDGGLKRRLELPSTGIPRTYRARAYGEIAQETLEGLIEGVEIDGIRYGSIDANLERRTGANVWIEMRITEGKNREVRRVLEYLGLQVSRLIRTAYGEFVLADLAAGGVVEVRQADLAAFRQTLG